MKQMKVDHHWCFLCEQCRSTLIRHAVVTLREDFTVERLRKYLAPEVILSDKETREAVRIAEEFLTASSIPGGAYNDPQRRRYP